MINAIIHNDYSYEGVPKFELFADRLKITSTGGIPRGQPKSSYSRLFHLHNKELMRIFRDLDLVEHLGSGMPRILPGLPEKLLPFFTDNFIRMSFPTSGQTHRKCR